MKTKDIFTLAVRLLGLYFLYIGLRGLDVPSLMDVTIIKGDNLDDIISTLLPVVFNLTVAWLLLGNFFLVRRAYPDSSKLAERFGLPPESATPVAKPVEPAVMSDLEIAEKKLAGLVGKPKA